MKLLKKIGSFIFFMYICDKFKNITIMTLKEIKHFFKKGEKIKREKWDIVITNESDLSKLSYDDMIADDWEVYREYDPELHELMSFLYDEIGFKFSSQSRHYDERYMDYQTLFNIIENYYLNDKDAYKKLLYFIKDNKLYRKEI